MITRPTGVLPQGYKPKLRASS